MGIKDKLFGKKREPQNVELPAIMQPEDPVNYNSVLDWLLGLSDKDYKTMQDVVNVYREAGKTTAKLLKIKDQPTTELLPKQPTDEETDTALDNMLSAHPDDLAAALIADEIPVKPKKTQTPKAKKIEVSESN